MIIIVEGIDRVGKTTLLNKIKEKLNIKDTFKVDRIEIENSINTSTYMNIGSTYRLAYMFNNYFKDRDLLVDRFHLTDYIYNIFLRKIDINKYIGYDIIENEMLKDNDNYILIMVEPTDIKKSSEEHGEDLTKYYELYEKLFDDSKLKNKIKCNYNTLDETVEKVRLIYERK